MILYVWFPTLLIGVDYVNSLLFFVLSPPPIVHSHIRRNRKKENERKEEHIIHFCSVLSCYFFFIFLVSLSRTVKLNTRNGWVGEC